MKNRLKLLLFCVSSILFISCDQVTKHIAREHLMFHAPITYLHNTIVLEYAENTGAALSLGENLSKTTSFWVFSIIPLLCLIALFIYVVRKVDGFNRLKLYSFAMIFAGGLGNIIDRIWHDRHVTDFMNVGIGNSFRTGIFNVADMCVTAGVIGLVIISFTEKKHEPITEPQQNQDDTASTQ